MTLNIRVIWLLYVELRPQTDKLSFNSILVFFELLLAIVLLLNLEMNRLGVALDLLNAFYNFIFKNFLPRFKLRQLLRDVGDVLPLVGCRLLVLAAVQHH